ncbi:MAG: MFS transporter [Deltaproteobacteria bacterium]|nr:MFS transporter [Deltaproteobacteria bacterium]
MRTVLRPLILGLSVLILTQTLSAALGVSSLQSAYLEGLLANLRVLGGAARQQLETGVQYGKPLGAFAGGQEILADLHALAPSLDSIQVFDTTGKILFSLVQTGPTGHDAVGEIVPGDLLSFALSDTSKDEPFILGKHRHIVFPIVKSGTLQGFLTLQVTEETIRSRLEGFVRWNLTALSWTVLVVGLALWGWLGWVSAANTDPTRLRRWSTIVLFLFIGGSQVVFAFMNVKRFQETYRQGLVGQAESLARYLQGDIEFLLSKGLSIQRLVGMDSLLEQVVSISPSVSRIAMYDDDGQTVAEARQGEGAYDGQTITVPLFAYGKTKHRHKAVEGYVAVTTNESMVEGRVRGVLFDSATVAFICFVFLAEILALTMAWIRPGPVRAEDEGVGRFVRSAGFLFFLGYDMSVSFLPLYMNIIYEPLFGLSRDVVLGLPISAEMFMAFFGILCSGPLSDRKGWRTSFIAGTVAAVAGAALSGLTSEPVPFILARGLAGFGFGMLIISLQTAVLSDRSGRGRAKGIANAFAGIFAGSICGNAVGAMLAERLGFGPVFVAGAGVMLLALAYGILFVRSPRAVAIKAQAGGQVRRTLRFLLERRVMFLWMCIGVPGSIVLVGLLYYFAPIHLKELGVTQANIGRILMVYGLCIIYLAPPINQWVDRAERKAPFVALAGILGSLSLLVFTFWGGVWAVLTAVVLIGLSNCLGAASTVMFALEHDSARSLGEDTAVSAYRSMERIGQVMGPVIFALLVGTGLELGTGLQTLGIVYAVTTLVFVLGTLARPRKVSARVVQEDVLPAGPVQKIRTMEPEDSSDFVDGVRVCYGETYPDQRMYNPDIVAAMLKNGDMVSCVAVWNGLFSGHLGLLDLKETSLGYLYCGLVVVRTRGQNTLAAMIESLGDRACQNGRPGIFFEVVCSHPMAQKSSIRAGAVPVGYLPGHLPGTIEYKGILPPEPRRRNACLYYMTCACRRSGRSLMPEAFFPVAATIFQSLGLERSLVTADRESVPESGTKTRLQERCSPEWQTMEWYVQSVGDDFSGCVRHVLASTSGKDYPCRYLYLSTSDPAVACAGKILVDEGFIPGGVVPCMFEDGDGLLYQYLEAMELADDQLVSDQAKMLKDWVMGFRAKGR